MIFLYFYNNFSAEFKIMRLFCKKIQTPEYDLYLILEKDWRSLPLIPLIIQKYI